MSQGKRRGFLLGRTSRRRTLSVNDLETVSGGAQPLTPYSWPSVFWQVVGDVFQSVVQAFLLLIILTSLIGHFEIQQTSMEPNFHEGQRVIVNQMGQNLPDWLVSSAHAHTHATAGRAMFGPRRGQVVVFYDTPQPQGPPLIKRVIGTPGDTVEIREGQVLVNGEALDEPYVHGLATSCSVYCGPFTLGEDEYFFLGDNRSGSRDSRNFGPISRSQIVGRVIVRYWPLNQFTLFE